MIRVAVFLLFLVILSGLGLVSALVFSFVAAPPSNDAGSSSLLGAQSLARPINPIPAPDKSGSQRMEGGGKKDVGVNVGVVE